MRFTGVLGVVCILAAPALGVPVTYSFDLTSGSMTVTMRDWQWSANATSGMDGTFAVTVYQSDGHVGESDTFVLEDSSLLNTDAMAFPYGSMNLAANLAPGSIRLLDFAPDGPDHIGPGGVAAVDTDVFVDVAITVEGTIGSSGFWTSGWAGRLLPFDMSFTTSQSKSDVLVVTVGGTFGYEIGNTVISQTITLDLIVDVVGTAHVVPDPALGGLVAMGLGGAGTWLRRRRR